MLQKLLEMFISKKKIIAYVSAVIIAVVAAVLGMSSDEVKDAVVSGPVIDLPKVEAPLIPADKK
jgi:hypothetical protein